MVLAPPIRSSKEGGWGKDSRFPRVFDFNAGLRVIRIAKIACVIERTGDRQSIENRQFWFGTPSVRLMGRMFPILSEY
jgi:hypothetical protein